MPAPEICPYHVECKDYKFSMKKPCRNHGLGCYESKAAPSAPTPENDIRVCRLELAQVKLLLSMAVDEIDNAVDNGWVLVDDFEFYVPSKKILGRP